MPEQYQKGPSPWTLSKAVSGGEIVRVRCGHCNITRYYDPADLLKLVGDVWADAIRMRCERCGKTEWIGASFELLPASERQRIRLRRLVEVRMVRKVIWRDE